MHRNAWTLLFLLGLAACGTSAPTSHVGNYVGGAIALECAPFARALSGVTLRGVAAEWWWQADGRYSRSRVPAVGSVLVFDRSDRLPDGHVAVVSRVLSDREILVTQANWVHHRVTEDQPVVDVSSRGNWSVVRVWWPPASQMGVNDYRTLGFIQATRSATHDALTAATPGAIHVALNGG